MDRSSFACNAGKNLQSLRKQYHLTQAQLAEKLEVSVSHIANIERGETSISLCLVQKIVELFSITPNDLLLDKNSEEHSSGSPQEKIRRLVSERLNAAAYLILQDIENVQNCGQEEDTYSIKRRTRDNFSDVAE